MVDPDPTPEELEKRRKEKEEKELAEEVEKLKKEYEEKQKKKKEKGKDKEKSKDKDKKGNDEKDKEEKDKEEEKDKKQKAEETTLEAKKIDEEPRIFTLHKYLFCTPPSPPCTNNHGRAFFETRLRRFRQQQIARLNQERIRSPSVFPSVPRGDPV